MTTTLDRVARLIVAEARVRQHTRDECLAEMSCLYQESGWREDVWDVTRTTYGVAQQDASYPNRMDGAKAQVRAFYDRLDLKRRAPGAGDIWLTLCWLQQAPNWPSAQFWYDHGRRGYLDEIRSRISAVTPYLDQLWPATQEATMRPAFNEFPVWSVNNSDRGNTRIDAFLLHTQEGGGGNAAAEDLAKWFANGNAVSYHYTISQASDGGVTVVDCVDTDRASWSVLSANPRSINLCFAGSRASWTRTQWLKQGNAIDVAAYLAVQDAKKYRFPTTVIAPPYTGRLPGISDHGYVTRVLGDGTHTDVGAGFPWDVFTTAVNKYTTGLKPETPTEVVKVPPASLSDRQLLEDIWTQLRGPAGKGWPQLGGLTLVDALAQVRDKL